MWVFLLIQAIFAIWLITSAATHTGASAADVARLCRNGAWRGFYSNYSACTADAGKLLNDAGTIGKGVALGLIIALWAATDIILGIGYGIWRLARRLP